MSTIYTQEEAMAFTSSKFWPCSECGENPVSAEGLTCYPCDIERWAAEDEAAEQAAAGESQVA